jgi:hypothetical protein
VFWAPLPFGAAAPSFALPAAFAGIASRDRRSALIRGILITVCGLVALLTPLLLWTAWSPRMFWLIIASGCAALLILYVLIWTSRDGDF